MRKILLLLTAVTLQFPVMAQTPATPTISSFSDYYALQSYGEISFQLPANDTENNSLDTEKLFYNIYFDDKAYTFTNDWYSKVTTDMTDVPYSYSDNLDFFVSGEKHDLFFYMEDYSHVGVQSIYKDGEKEYRSPIVYSDGQVVTAISHLDNDRRLAKVVSTDLMGRRVDASYHGVVLQTKVYDNGESHTVKVVK